MREQPGLAVRQKTENGKLSRSFPHISRAPLEISLGNLGISYLEIQGTPNYLMAKK
jgi:hypothetical protein